MGGSASGGMASSVPASGKGGTSGQQAMPAPTQGQYAPLATQGNFNVNQASAGALQQSMQGAQAGMGFQPGQINPIGYQANTVGAGQLAGRNLDPYTNPYESQVVQQTLSDLGGAQVLQMLSADHVTVLPKLKPARALLTKLCRQSLAYVKLALPKRSRRLKQT